MPGKTNKKDIDLSIDTEFVNETLTGFIEDCFEKTGAKKAIIGLSGGLDSSVAAKIAADALGGKRVVGVIMPYKTSSLESKEDAILAADSIGIGTIEVDITPMVDSFYENDITADDTRRGNMMARQRMSVLYDISAKESGLVIGTSNKSEILLGYGTIFGDLACAVNPIGDLYKTQERQFGHYLELPEKILNKTPTADLVEGQTDEDDLGFTYEEVDPLLYLMIDEKLDKSALIEYGFKEKFIDDVSKRIRRNHFKRIPPLIAKLSKRTVGHEFRYAWDWSTIK